MSDTADPAWLTIANTEEIKWQGQPRLSAIAPWIALSAGGLIGLLAAVGLGILPPLAGLLAPLALVPAVGAFLSLRQTAYLLTTERVAVRSGLIGYRVTAVPLERIQNSSFNQSVLGKLNGYGTVTLESASGSDSVRFRRIDNPQEVRSVIDRLRVGSGSESVPGSPEAWAAALREMRALRAAFEP